MPGDPFTDLQEFLALHLRRYGLAQKHLCLALGEDEGNFSKRLSGKRRPLTLVEAETLADEVFEWSPRHSDTAEYYAEFLRLVEQAQVAYQPSVTRKRPSGPAKSETQVEPDEGEVDEVSPPPTNVSPPEAPLFGRQAKLDELKDLLASDRRLITLVGSGGVGKTRLALAVASEMLGHFKDGVWFVDLAAVIEPERVPLTIASVIEQSARIDDSLAPRDRLLESVRGKKMLLILDNFEHVMSQALLVNDLRRASSQLKLLITSREPLHLINECRCEVEPLDVVGDYPSALDNPGVALFVERARSSGFELDLTPDTVDQILELCRRLAGLPLAIKLAASQLHYRRSVAAVLADLASRIKWVGERDEIARHQTLFKTIDWSYTLLSPREQWLFRWLAVFPGSMTESALRALEAEAPGADGPANGGLPQSLYLLLVDKSLLHHSDTSGSELRWRLLPHVREFALQKLEANTTEHRGARQWHADYYWRMVVQETGSPPSLLPAALVMPQSDMEHQRLRGLIAERENLWAALDWYAEVGALERGLRMVSRLREYWVWFGMVDQGRRYLDEFLRASEAIRVEALYVAGQLAGRQGEFATARQKYEDCLTSMRVIGNKAEEARVYNDLGIVAFLEGQYDLARHYYDQSLRLREVLGDREGQAKTLNNLGLLYLALKEYGRARTALEQSVAIRQTLNNPALLALGQNSLGDLCLAEGRVVEARHALGQCLALLIDLDRPEVDADFLDSLSHLAFLSGRLERSVLFLSASDARRAQRRWPRSAWDRERVQYLAGETEQNIDPARLDELRDVGGKLDDGQVIDLARAEVVAEDGPLSTAFR